MLSPKLHGTLLYTFKHLHEKDNKGDLKARKEGWNRINCPRKNFVTFRYVPGLFEMELVPF